MDKQQLNRYIFYSLGVVFLSAGITLNTKTALGVSPLISLPYAVSQIWHLSFPVMIFVLYISFVILQFILKGKNRESKDILQIPLSLAFSILLDFFGTSYDKLMNVFGLQLDSLILRFLLLLIAVALTGIGVSMMISMNLIPNPADGLAQAVGDAFKRNLGFGKNFIDISSVFITCSVGIIFGGHLIGVGIGTIIAMIGVGRCIAVFNYFFHKKMMHAIGNPSSMQISLQ